jgi:viroplasmin and RNaseH domain-containing protein
MTLAKHILLKLLTLSVSCEIDDNSLVVNIDDSTCKIRIDTEWEEAYLKYKRARSISFDTNNRIMCHNKSAEMPLARLDQDYYRDVQYTFNDLAGNYVNIGRCSAIYSLSHFDSSIYPEYFQKVVKRRLSRQTSRTRQLNTLMTSPFTAIYTANSRRIPTNLADIAMVRVKSCLFKLAVEQRDCLEIWKQRDHRCLPISTEDIQENFTIPKAFYDDNVVSYYKVACSSPFPSQSFLDYYHVLEYHFLRVSEDKLHYQIRTMVNETSFKANEDSLDKLIALIRKQDAKNDETEMLRSVIQKFVPEDEFIAYIKYVEEKCGHKLYTKKRKVFGELIEIAPNEGHAISNAAKALKHIRNAIVHSSDGYKREDCHIPLTESEDLIEEFIPLVRFFAEKVICGTAT